MYSMNTQLTNREREVLCLVASGHSDHKIAESLTISPRTVNRHMSNILNKLDVSSRAAATAHAIRRGLI
jgi:DNA-binding NarL/FixJ family response regulator